MKFDEILTGYLGEFGLYQKRLYLLVCLMVTATAWQGLITIFTLDIPPHRCQIPGYPNDTYAIQSWEHERYVNLSIPRDKAGKFDKCLVYDVNITYDDVRNGAFSLLTNETDKRACDAWVYDKSVFPETIAGKLNMICQRKFYRSHSYLVFSFGKLAGSILQGVISDAIGRKKCLIFFIALDVATAFASAFISDMVSLLALRFLSSFSTIGSFMTAFVISLELVGPRKRMWTGMLIELFWVLSQFLLVLVGYLVRDWQTMTLIMAAPGPLLLVYFWFIPESPRWLISKGRIEEAKVILRKAAEVNKVMLPEDVLQSLEKAEEAKDRTPREKPWRLFTTDCRVTVRYLIVLLNWIVVATTYYGLTLNVANLSGDIFLNLALSEGVELLGYSVPLLVMDRLGRKVTHTVSMLTAGVACLAIIAPYLLSKDGVEVAMIVLSNVGKLGISAAFALIYVYTGELYPTVLRNFGMGLSSMTARIGTMAAPYMADLGLVIGGDFGKALPLIIFGGCSLVAGGLALLLPETLRQEMPETIQDARDFGRSKKGSENIKSKETVVTKF